jgi:glycosyltransferase involved in cell wall biosynthesis
MKISIITPCLNSAATIRDTLESVFRQSYNDVESIVVDGGSTDGTLSILAEYEGRIAKVITGRDRNSYDAINKGLAAATGDVIGILNADDFFESPYVLDSVRQALQESPEADLVFGDVVFVRPPDMRRIVRYYSSRGFRPWKLRFGWMPPHPGTFIRRTACERIGPYSIDLKISADYEMFVKALLVHRLRFRRIDRVMARMRVGGLSTSGIASSTRLNSEIVTACRRNGVYTNLFLLLSKVPFKLLELLPWTRRAPTDV